jgi:8-oxo-dGTP diphosphatase
MTRAGESAFLASYDPSAYARLSVSVDVVLLALVDDELRTVLVRREEHPFRGAWALPGGFVGIGESLDAAAARVLKTKVHARSIFAEQLYTFGAPDRDPRTRVISVAYYALLDRARFERIRLDETVRSARIRVPWPGVRGGAVDLLDERGRALPAAFDHREIAGTAVKRLRGKLAYTPVGYALLPERFTLLQLQRVHEAVLGARLNKDSFRRRMLASGQLDATGEMQDGVDHRPAALYRAHG